MRVTIKDIAKIAGVDHSTVSRSLNDSSRVSIKTKEKIKKIAEELGFEFNHNARALSSKKTGTIGLIYPETYEQTGTSLFLAYLLKNIQRIFEKHSLDVIIKFPKNKFTNESNIKKIISQRKVDGLIITSPDLSPEDWEYINKFNIPVVFLHFRPKYFHSDKIDYVYTDHKKGGYIATKYLLNLGHKKIFTVTDEMYDTQFQDRTHGYQEALEEAGYKLEAGNVFKCKTSFEAGYELAKENLTKFKNADAIFAQTDIVALGIQEYLKLKGIKIPEDVSIVGYDGLEIGEFFSPKLTTVLQPKDKLADLACERLVEILTERKEGIYLHKILEPELLIRESCMQKK